jgi:hypothetical protein
MRTVGSALFREAARLELFFARSRAEPRGAHLTIEVLFRDVAHRAGLDEPVHHVLGGNGNGHGAKHGHGSDRCRRSEASSKRRVPYHRKEDLARHALP